MRIEFVNRKVLPAALFSFAFFCLKDYEASKSHATLLLYTHFNMSTSVTDPCSDPF